MHPFLDRRLLELPDRLLDLLPVGICVFDRAGRVIRHNRAVADLVGYAPAIGSKMSCVEPYLAEVLSTGLALREQDLTIARPDGVCVPAWVDIEPIKDDANVVIGAVNVFCVNPKDPAAVLAPDASRQSENLLLRVLPAAIYRTDAVGRITFYNDAAAELWGLRPILGRAMFCGSWKLFLPSGASLPYDASALALTLKERRSVSGMEAIAERPDGSRRNFISYPVPLFDDQNALTGAINMLLDITERREAEQLLYKSEARYRDIAAIVESSEDAVLSKDLDGIIRSWNRGAERLFGFTPEEAIGKPVTILIPSDRHDEEPAILARIRRGERVDHYETIRQRKDGSIVDISLTISPLRNMDGTIVGASKIARDITERRRAEEHQRLLLREMDHRVKNLFALSSGVVGLSARSAKTPEELSSSVQARLAALARAHALTLAITSEGNDRREQASTTMHALIQTILLPYEGRTEGGEPRIVVSGADIPIGGGAVMSFALLLHEFTTNAAKYGALLSPSGTITIVCSKEGDAFVLIWTERDGPPVAQRPEGEGFGTTLARATVERQLEGTISRDWKPEGLTIRLSVAMDRILAR